MAKIHDELAEQSVTYFVCLLHSRIIIYKFQSNCYITAFNANSLGSLISRSLVS